MVSLAKKGAAWWLLERSRRRRAAPFAPTNLAGAVLWLRADLGVEETGAGVSLWEDQSGSGNDATQTTDALRPIFNESSANLNGAPTVQFTAAGTHAMHIAADAVLEDGTGDGFTVVAALHQDALGAASQDLISGRNAADTAELRIATEISGSDEVGFYNNQWVGCGEDATLVDQSLAWRTTNGSGAAGTCEVFRDGVSIGTATPGASSVAGLADHAGGSGNRLSIGSYRAQNQEWLNAEVAELIVYSRKLSDGEIATIHGYMATRYGI